MLNSVLCNIRVVSLQSNLCLKTISVCAQQKFRSSTTQPDSSAPSAPKKPKTTPIPKITLIAQENVSITTLDEAQKLSKRRDLKLVKIVDLDTKTQRPVYKLMTGSEYHAEDLKQRDKRKKDRESSNAIKGEKILIVASSIAEHDLQIHVNKILKWIVKKYEVRVVINGDASNMDKAENVYKFLEQHLQNESRILQKRTKGNDIKFQILPVKKSNEEAGNS